MINAAIVGASLSSAMKYAAPALDKLGYDSRDFMGEVMRQLGEQGVPGAQGLFGVESASSIGSAPAFSAAIENSGQGSFLA